MKTNISKKKCRQLSHLCAHRRRVIDQNQLSSTHAPARIRPPLYTAARCDITRGISRLSFSLLLPLHPFQGRRYSAPLFLSPGRSSSRLIYRPTTSSPGFCKVRVYAQCCCEIRRELRERFLTRSVFCGRGEEEGGD